MNPLAWIMGGGKTADKAIDAIINTGDALVFTGEEQSVANQKKLDWLLSYMQATGAQSVARRMITCVVVLAWFIILMAACIAGYFNRSDGSYAVWLFDVLRDVIANPYNIVLGFYFLTGTVRAFVGKGDGK